MSKRKGNFLQNSNSLDLLLLSFLGIIISVASYQVLLLWYETLSVELGVNEIDLWLFTIMLGIFLTLIVLTIKEKRKKMK